MSNPEFKLDTNAPTVSWADPNPKNGEASTTAQVKSVYVKNLPKNVTQEQLKKLFEHHGEITKVVLPPAKAGHENRYGFVHFKDRLMAMKALKNTERYELDGHLLDCSLAKPPAEKKDDTVQAPTAKGGPPLLPSYAPLGYGMMPVPGAYGALPTGISQPMLYAPGAPPGATMVPMVLPDGRFGYVLQQPAMQPTLASPSPRGQQGARHGGIGGGGSSRSGAKRHAGESNSGSRSKGRHRPY